MPPERPQPKIVTPNMVAEEYFGKELERHAASPSKTVVIVHDACYGHRFSRPRTSKAALSTIVERPERILATLLGAATAYVRLGGRHDAGPHPPHPDKRAPPHSVPFQIRKTARSVPLNHAAVTAIHGAKWMEELQVMCDTAEAKLAMNGKELIRPIGYGKDETGKALPKLHEGDLYLSSESLAALQGCLGGICEAVDSVFTSTLTQRAFVCIRPPGHHCSSNFPSGFCWLNNVHVGISYAAMNHGLTHAAIIDFDLHHGDGSQAVTWDHNRKARGLPKNATAHKKTPIGYYSLHDINSYPCEWGDDEKVRNASLCVENAHGQSIWNVHLEPWQDHAEFWNLYETRYVVLLEKTRSFLRHHSQKLRRYNVQPNAAIFISAGFDASEWEGAGMQRHGVNVPTDFYARFTSDIVRLAQEEDLGVNGRVISVLEGGYSDRALTSGVLSHVCGLVDEPYQKDVLNKGVDPAAHMAHSASESSTTHGDDHSAQQLASYEPTWWDVPSLDWIEAVAAGRVPPIPSEKSDKAPGNYSSPTQASSARMTDVAKERRSLTAQLEARLSMVEKPVTPPPDVDWAVAAYELSRLIIPSDRQTLSCRHDELNAEATRARKERQSAIGVATAPTVEPMQLRERRAKAPPLPSAPSRSSSRTREENRRTTIASFGDLPDATIPQAAGEMSARTRRRSSAASSIMSGFSAMKLGDPGQDLPAPTSKQIPSSSSSRPAMQAPPVTMVKAPAVRKPRGTVAKSSAPTKPAAKRVNLVQPALSRQASNASDRSASMLQQRQASVADDRSADMDGITDAMKAVSIRLTMPTEEQHVANQKKREEEQRPKAAKATRKPPVPRATKTKAPAKTFVAPVSDPAVEGQQPVDNRADHGQMLSLIDSQDPDSGRMASKTPLELASVADQMSVPPPPKEEPLISKPPPAQDWSAHVPYPLDPPLMLHQNEQQQLSMGAPKLPVDAAAQETTTAPPPSAIGVPAGHAHPQATPAPNNQYFTTSMPPPPPPLPPYNEPSMRPMTPNHKTKADLPVFTSTSPIPFSPRTNITPSDEDMKREHGGKSIWDLPETPR